MPTSSIPVAASPETNRDRPSRWVLPLLAAAVSLGAVCAVIPGTGARGNNASALPTDAVAVVNGTPIRRADYERAVEMIGEDKRGGLTAADYRLALDRLIEEELLIEYGLAEDLLQSDRAVRQAVVQSMLGSILAESRSAQPSEDELRRYYDENLLPLAAGFYGIAPEEVAARGLAPPPFDAVRETLVVAYRRQAEDAALTDYLTWLRADAEIVTRKDGTP